MVSCLKRKMTMTSDIKGINNTFSQTIAETGIIEDASSAVGSAHVLVNILGLPVNLYDDLEKNKFVRSTTGTYYIGYTTNIKSFRGYDYKPFYVVCDLVGFNFRVNNAEQFRREAKKYPEVEWLLKYTNYSDELFDIAKAHFGIRIPFCLNVVEYVKHLKEQGANDLPLVVTKNSEDTLKGKLYIKPNKGYYQKQLIETNKLAHEMYRKGLIRRNDL